MTEQTDQPDQPDQPEPPAPTPGGPESTSCYRHPQREAHVRCTRCNRRICPDCMVEASVGFQCPDCVREGNAGVRAARTSFGGRISDDTGYVTKILIGINVAMMVAEYASSSVTKHLELVGRAFDPFTGFYGVAEGDYWRLITATFLHAGLVHLAMNMYALYLFGPPLEAALGRVRFAVLYVVSALGGSAASYAFSAPNQPSLGASGAVFGLFGAFFVVNHRLGRDTSGLVVLLVINLAFSFLVPNIDWRAHVGGLMTGSLVGLVLVYAPRAHRTLVQAAGTGVVVLAILSVIVWRTAELTMV